MVIMVILVFNLNNIIFKHLSYINEKTNVCGPSVHFFSLTGYIAGILRTMKLAQTLSRFVFLVGITYAPYFAVCASSALEKINNETTSIGKIVDMNNAKDGSSNQPTRADRKPRSVVMMRNGLGSREHASLNAAKVTLAGILLRGLSGPGKRNVGQYSLVRQPEIRLPYYDTTQHNIYGDFVDSFESDDVRNSMTNGKLGTRDEGKFEDNIGRDFTGELPKVEDRIFKQVVEKRPYSSRDDLGYKSRIQAGSDVARDRQAFDDIFGSHGAGRR